MTNDNTISGPKLKAAAQAATGTTLSLRSVQRAKQKLGETSDEQQASLMAKLRSYLCELEQFSPGTVLTNVEARAFSSCNVRPLTTSFDHLSSD